MHDDGTSKYLCKVMALPFLPEEDIVPMFERLSSSVLDNDKGLQCDNCKRWTHINCENTTDKMYKVLQECEKELWFCGKCKNS